jgi:hypothetical protein
MIFENSKSTLNVLICLSLDFGATHRNRRGRSDGLASPLQPRLQKLSGGSK